MPLVKEKHRSVFKISILGKRIVFSTFHAKMFQKHILDIDSHSFSKLQHSVEWEQFSKNRQGAILVHEEKDDSLPIIRTTTSYKKPSQKFSLIHHNLIEEIRTRAGEELYFNNAMIEIYDSKYTKMGFHSDQALDLDENSYICLFSCYEDENENWPRKLVVKNKITGDTFDILLNHNSAVLFSKKDNDEHLHKIVTDIKAPKSKWLGLTFRLSKTFVKKHDNVFTFQNGKQLTQATETEKMEFFKHKSLENAQVGYKYPEIYYTLSNH